MLKRRSWVALGLLMGVLALIPYAPITAQTDTATSAASTANQAVFVNVATPYTTPGPPVTNTDVEQGFTDLGTATFNVDATSVYTISATTNFTGTTTGTTAVGATLAAGKTEFTACQLDLNTTGFVDGDPGPSIGAQPKTTGTPGTDHTVGLHVDWTQYTDAPNGTYTCDVQVTVTD